MEDFLIKNLEELRNFSLFLSKIMSKNSFLALCGEMGSGKTTLVRFLCHYLGIKENVSSPTFNIMKSYRLEGEKHSVNHFDFFRILGNEDASIFEEFKDGNINLAEWADLSPSFWVNEKLLIYLKIVFVSSDVRSISITIFK